MQQTECCHDPANFHGRVKGDLHVIRCLASEAHLKLWTKLQTQRRNSALTVQHSFHSGVDELLCVASFAQEAPRTLQRPAQLHVQLKPDLLRIKALCVQLRQRCGALADG